MTSPNHYHHPSIYHNLVTLLMLISISATFTTVNSQFGSFMGFPPFRPNGFSTYRPSLFPPAFANFPQPPWSRPTAPPVPQYRITPGPPSPARQCRNTGACSKLDHGTTLPTTWRTQATTTPQPATSRPVHLLLDRTDASSPANTTTNPLHVRSSTTSSNLTDTFN